MDWLIIFHPISGRCIFSVCIGNKASRAVKNSVVNESSTAFVDDFSAFFWR
jgi:hypothetical protein